MFLCTNNELSKKIKKQHKAEKILLLDPVVGMITKLSLSSHDNESKKPQETENINTTPPVKATSIVHQQRTIIAEHDSIQGDLRSAGGIELYGQITGNISSDENVKLCGKLIGNATGQDIEICSGQIKGDINASGYVRMDNNSIVLGNISAGSLSLNGKVKGNLQIQGNLTIESSAAISGSINADRISIQDGATLIGDVQIQTKDCADIIPENIV